MPFFLSLSLLELWSKYNNTLYLRSSRAHTRQRAIRRGKESANTKAPGFYKLCYRLQARIACSSRAHAKQHEVILIMQVYTYTI